MAAVAFDPAGNLYVLDTQAARISVVDLGGSLVRQTGQEGEGPGEFAGASAPMLRFTVLGDGRIAVYDPGRRAFAMFRGDGKFERSLRAGVLPDGGVAFTDSSAYAIKITAPGGALSRILTRPFGTVPVTDGVKAAYVERELEDLQRSAERGDAGARQWPISGAPSSSLWRSITRFRSYEACERVWKARSGFGAGADEPGSNGPIDLITADGRYLGSFARDATGLPSAFGPDGLVAFVQSNDLDVQTVVVKRLPPEVR